MKYKLVGIYWIDSHANENVSVDYLDHRSAFTWTPGILISEDEHFYNLCRSFSYRDESSESNDLYSVRKDWTVKVETYKTIDFEKAPQSLKKKK